MKAHDWSGGQEPECKRCGITNLGAYPSGHPGIEGCPTKLQVLVYLRDVVKVLYEECPREEYWRFILRGVRGVYGPDRSWAERDEMMKLPLNLQDEYKRLGELRWYGKD